MPAMIRCPECSGQGCSHCGGDGWYEDVYSADDPDAPDGWYEDNSDDYQQDEWHDSWEDEDWDYTPDPLHEWRYPEFRPSFVAIFRWWGVQYLPVWLYGVARSFWFDSVVPHFRSDDNIGDIPF